MSDFGNAFDGFTATAGQARVHRTRIRPDDWEPDWKAMAGVNMRLGEAELIGRFEPNTEPWYEARRGGLGGSEIAAVVGLSKYDSAYSLWLKKAGQLNGDVDLAESNEPVEWGNRLEPVIIAKYQELFPQERWREGATYRHSIRRWQTGNPDLLSEDGQHLLETKFALYDYAWGADGTDQIPIHYRCQVTQYMDVLGIDHATLAVLIGGYDFRVYHIDFDLADALYLRQAGAAFVESLRTGEVPAIDDSWQSKDATEWLHPEIERKDVQIDLQLARDYEEACRLYKEAGEHKAGMTARINDALDGARRAMVGEVVVASRVPGRGDNPPYLKVSPRLRASDLEAPTREALLGNALAGANVKEQVEAIVEGYSPLAPSEVEMCRTRWKVLPRSA